MQKKKTMSAESSFVTQETFTVVDSNDNPSPHTFAATNVADVLGFSISHIQTEPATVQSGTVNTMRHTLQATFVYTKTGGDANDRLTLDLHRFNAADALDVTQTHGNVQLTRDRGVAGFRVIPLYDTIRGGRNNDSSWLAVFADFGQSGAGSNFRVQSRRYNIQEGETIDTEYNNNDHTANQIPSDTHLITTQGRDTNTYITFVASRLGT